MLFRSAVIGFQCSAVQQITVQCLPIRFAPRISAACCAMVVFRTLPCALGPPVALHLALSRYTSCHSRSIVAALPRLSAALRAANVQ